MSKILIEHLSLVSTSTDGVKRLRQLILELAVRGKLVPQDLNDEPASCFLINLRRSQINQIEKNKIGKAPCEITPLAKKEKSYIAPPSWMWCRLGEIVVNCDSERIPLSREIRRSRQGEYDYYGASGVIDKVDDYIFDSPRLLIGEDGANLINRSSPIAFIAKGKYWVNNHAHVLDPGDASLMQYLQIYINGISLLSYITGTAQPKMNQAKMNSIPIAVPPVEEQKRIIAKVDELMALCDRLEAQQNDAEEAHKLLVKVLLDTLIQSKDRSAFLDSWRLIKDNFDILFSTEDSVDVLKQTILQLAVMGKLVPHDPSDEPASAVLQDCLRNKNAILNELSVRTRPAVSLNSTRIPFAAPLGWEWVAMDDVFVITGGVTLGRKLAGKTTVSVPYLRVANVQRGYLDLGLVKEIELEPENVYKYQLKNEDLLIVEGGDWDKVGRTSIWRNQLKVCLHQNHIFKVRKLSSKILSSWAEMFLNSAARKYFAEAAKQTTNLASINMTQLRNCPFAIPPVNEQKRIVGKVDELMALCDDLKEKLRSSSELQDLVATVLTADALNSDTNSVKEEGKILAAVTSE